MPTSEMTGDLKMMSSVLSLVNCDICQQETGICKHSRENGLLVVYQYLALVYQQLSLCFSVVIRCMKAEMLSVFSFK